MACVKDILVSTGMKCALKAERKSSQLPKSGCEGSAVLLSVSGPFAVEVPSLKWVRALATRLLSSETS